MKLLKILVQTRRSLVGLAFSWVGFSISLTASELPKRWISTSPQITELLFQLDLGDPLVGTTDQSFYPPKAEHIKRIGQLFAPNLEAILATAPDLILWDRSSFEPFIESRLASMGISSLEISLDKVEDVFNASRDLIQKFKSGKKSDDFIRAEIEWEILQRKKKDFSFIALAWGDPPILFGQKTFLFSLLEGFGGVGILPQHWKNQFLKVSEEWIMAQNPTYLFFLKHDESSAANMKIQCKKWWPQNENRCVGVSADKFARASLTPLLSLAELDFIWSQQK